MQMKAVAIFLILFGVHMNKLYIVKVKIHFLSNNEQMIQFRMINEFCEHGPISSKWMLLWCLFLDPHLITHHLNIGV